MLHKITQKVIHNLSEESWSQQSYFKERNGNIIACPLGVAQIFANKKVAQALRSPEERATILAVCNNHAYPSAAVAEKAFGEVKKGGRLIDIFHSRPQYVKDYYFNCGELSIHWLFGMFGVTSKFNRDKETTIEMVRERLGFVKRFANWYNI